MKNALAVIATLVVSGCDIETHSEYPRQSYGFHINQVKGVTGLPIEVRVAGVACDGPAKLLLYEDDHLLQIGQVELKKLTKAKYDEAWALYDAAVIPLLIRGERLVHGLFEPFEHVIEPRHVRGPFTCGRSQGRV
jgi:hypothetical protein